MNEFAALVLSLPTRNSTLRMRLWRALKDNGCAVLRDGVYLLPVDAPGKEALTKIESEIRSHGGFAMTLGLKATTDAQVAEIRKLFDRSADYGALVRGSKRLGYRSAAWDRGVRKRSFAGWSGRWRSSPHWTSIRARRGRRRRPLSRP